jgi:hypothetical protein
MSVEQIARDFITKMNDVDAAESYLTPDAVAACCHSPSRQRKPSVF